MMSYSTPNLYLAINQYSKSVQYSKKELKRSVVKFRRLIFQIVETKTIILSQRRQFYDRYFITNESLKDRSIIAKYRFGVLYSNKTFCISAPSALSRIRLRKINCNTFPADSLLHPPISFQIRAAESMVTSLRRAPRSWILAGRGWG